MQHDDSYQAMLAAVQAFHDKHDLRNTGGEELSYRVVIKKSRQTGSSALRADAWHHRSDAITSVLAFIGISIAVVFGEGYETADDWAAILAAGFILYNSYLIFRPALGEVMDEHLYDDLVDEVRALRSPSPIIAVDHEGGRVQRFRDGFTAIPPMRVIGRQYGTDPKGALALARQAGWLIAAELRACGVDLCFAPCVDLDWGVSDIIGDRSFHARPEVVAELAAEFSRGLRSAGMAAVCGVLLSLVHSSRPSPPGIW